MTDKASLWKNPTAVNWTFSRDYLGADNPEFKNTFILTCESQDVEGCRRRRRSAETDDYDYDYGGYNDANLQAGSGGDVIISGSSGCSCTPQNCPENFWTQEYVIGDGTYFTLEAYDVKPGKLQQMHCF